jgi:hypothetical protein
MRWLCSFVFSFFRAFVIGAENLSTQVQNGPSGLADMPAVLDTGFREINCDSSVCSLLGPGAPA